MIIQRYIHKQIAWTFLSLIGILTAISLSHKAIGLFAKVSAGELPMALLVQIIALYIPELFVYLTPLAFLLAIVYVYGQLHQQHALVVLLTSGYSWLRLTLCVMRLALCGAVVTAIVTLIVLPRVTHYREHLIQQGQITALVHSLVPGRFQTLQNGTYVSYIGRKDRQTGKLYDIFLASLQPQQDQHTILARTAEIGYEVEKKRYSLILQDGVRYKGQPGRADYTIMRFQEYGQVLTLPQAVVPLFDRVRSSSMLWQGVRPGDYAELQWRLAIPLSLIVLALIAVAVTERQMRTYSVRPFFTAVTAYILYYNLLIVCKKAIGRAYLTPWVGLWWVHLFFLGVGLAGIILLTHKQRLIQIWRKLGQ